MSHIAVEQSMVHYWFTEKELATFNSFQVMQVPAIRAASYYPVESCQAQPAKRIKSNDWEGSAFTHLEPQVCLRIFDYLEPSDIVRVVSTSKGWDPLFLTRLPNYYILLKSEEKQKAFYQLLCQSPNRRFMIRSIYHFATIKKNQLIKLLVSQPRFVEPHVSINQVHFHLRSTMKYYAYARDTANDALVISDVKICQDTGPRSQMVSIKVLEGLLSGSRVMKRLTLQGLIMQMPFGFSFFAGKHFPLLTFLDLSRSNIRMNHLQIILNEAFRLWELNLRGCDRLEKGDFKKVQDQIYLPHLMKIDLTETAVGEEDFMALTKIAPHYNRGN